MAPITAAAGTASIKLGYYRSLSLFRLLFVSTVFYNLVLIAVIAFGKTISLKKRSPVKKLAALATAELVDLDQHVDRFQKWIPFGPGNAI